MAIRVRTREVTYQGRPATLTTYQRDTKRNGLRAVVFHWPDNDTRDIKVCEGDGRFGPEGGFVEHAYVTDADQQTIDALLLEWIGFNPSEGE